MNLKFLEELVGRPVRMTPSGSATPERHGLLKEVNGDRLVVELFAATQEHQKGPFRVEVVHADGLVRFFTHGESDWAYPERILLEWPKQADRVQRREGSEATRVDIMLPVQIRNESEAPCADQQPNGQTLNISATGAALLTTEFLRPHETVRVSVEMPDGSRTPELSGRITRFGPGPRGRWFVAIRFVYDSEQEQEAVHRLLEAHLQAAPGSSADQA